MVEGNYYSVAVAYKPTGKHDVGARVQFLVEITKRKI